MEPRQAGQPVVNVELTGHDVVQIAADRALRSCVELPAMQIAMQQLWLRCQPAPTPETPAPQWVGNMREQWNERVKGLDRAEQAELRAAVARMVENASRVEWWVWQQSVDLAGVAELVLAIERLGGMGDDVITALQRFLEKAYGVRATSYGLSNTRGQLMPDEEVARHLAQCRREQLRPFRKLLGLARDVDPSQPPWSDPPTGDHEPTPDGPPAERFRRRRGR